VSTVYVDTSALARVLLEEPDASAITDALRTFDRRAASRLLRIELRRMGLRRDLLERSDILLSDVALVPLDDRALTDAETIAPQSVGTLDAIHLATAVRLAEADELDALMTFDKQLAKAAREHGLEVVTPV
jgi:predicted nucleic acid-binding protein